LPSVFGIRRRLPTSATAFFRHAGNQTRSLVSSQGRWPRPSSFSFSPRPPPCGGGDERRAVLYTPDSLQPRCRFLPFSRVCPTAMLFRTRHPRGVSPKRLSADLRARVSGPSEGRVPRTREADHASFVGCGRFLNALADVVPLLGFPEDIPMSPVRWLPRVELLTTSVDRSSSPFQRHTAKRAAILKNGMPFTVVTTALG
jgi:hypothetical protein